MLLAPAMVWSHLTMMLGRTKGWSGQRQYGLTEVSAGFEEEEKEEEAAAGEAEAEEEEDEEEDLVAATPMNYPLFSQWLLII